MKIGCRSVVVFANYLSASCYVGELVVSENLLSVSCCVCQLSVGEWS